MRIQDEVDLVLGPVRDESRMSLRDQRLWSLDGTRLKVFLSSDSDMDKRLT